MAQQNKYTYPNESRKPVIASQSFQRQLILSISSQFSFLTLKNKTMRKFAFAVFLIHQ